MGDRSIRFLLLKSGSFMLRFGGAFGVLIDKPNRETFLIYIFLLV
jgi:hypothetical protein